MAATSLGVLFYLGATGWPGGRGLAERQFCEAPHDGPIMQPANTFSNAGFYLVGLWVGWQASIDVAARKRANWSNRVVTTVAYPATLASCSILIGAGSTALHASGSRWGAELDLLSMHVWAAWCVAFATVRLFRAGDREFFSLWFAQIGALATRLAWGEPYTLKGSQLFGAMIALGIAIEVAGRWRNRKRQRMDDHYLLCAIGTFLAAYACYLTSGSDGPWCDPSSWWQGHAAWHVLCAGATVFVYLYGRSERTVRERLTA